jgi:hypothetical protein
MNIDRILSQMKDYHVPVSIFIFAVGAVMKWFGHLDMAFVSFTGVIIGGITGHAFSPAQKDHDEGVNQ